MVLSGPSLMRQISSTYWGRCMVLSVPSLMRLVSSRTGEGDSSLRSLTDEAGIIYVLENVDGYLRSLTDEAGIIYVLEKVIVLSGPSLMR